MTRAAIHLGNLQGGSRRFLGVRDPMLELTLVYAAILLNLSWLPQWHLLALALAPCPMLAWKRVELSELVGQLEWVRSLGIFFGVALITIPPGWLMLSLLNAGRVDPVIDLHRLSYLIPLALAEEWFFRGYMQLRLNQIAGRKLGIGLSALLFAVAHVPAQGLIHATLVLLPGLALAWTRDRTGSFLASWWLHVAYNLVASAQPLD